MASGIKCPHCSQKISLPSSADRSAIACPMCKKTIELPPTAGNQIPNRNKPVAEAPASNHQTPTESARGFANSDQSSDHFLTNSNVAETDSASSIAKLGCGFLVILTIGLAVLVGILCHKWLNG